MLEIDESQENLGSISRSRRARLRLERTCERTNSSLIGKLNVELVPFFTAVGAAVKLPVRSAKIKRLSVQRIHH